MNRDPRIDPQPKDRVEGVLGGMRIVDRSGDVLKIKWANGDITDCSLEHWRKMVRHGHVTWVAGFGVDPKDYPPETGY